MSKDILDRIEVRQGDITTLDVDAIVNAANESLLGGASAHARTHVGERLLPGPYRSATLMMPRRIAYFRSSTRSWKPSFSMTVAR